MNWYQDLNLLLNITLTVIGPLTNNYVENYSVIYLFGGLYNCTQPQIKIRGLVVRVTGHV